MKTKQRLLLPIALVATLILLSITGGLWWYDRTVDRSGWIETDGIRYYQDFHAQKVSGWLELDEGRYYLEDGIPRTGWLTLDNETYYLGIDGVMCTGFLELDGKTRYFGANGQMVEGWLWMDSDRYYLKDGILASGFLELDGQHYFFDPQGRMLTGFQTIRGQSYYFFPDGPMAVGTAEIDGQSYLFQPDGVLFTGWAESEDGKRFYLPDGPMAIGWHEFDDGLHLFEQNGLCATGWRENGEDRYYFLENGLLATGPTVIDGQTHYFSPKGIEVFLVNALNPIPSYIQQNIVNFVDYHNVDSRCYEALKQMLADCEAAGISYTFNSAHRTLKEQTTILDLRTKEHMAQYNLSFAAARQKALQTVAIPNTSEHQLGLSVDLLGKEANAWLHEHCWEYGFILRYPSGKENITGITNEPWHFRYVGKSVAMDMKDTGLCLEEYLGAEAVTPQRKAQAAAAYMVEPEDWEALQATLPAG